MQIEQRLSMLVVNAQQLQSGLSAQRIFTHEGGVIGSSPAAKWRLSDAYSSVQAQHCEVAVIDGEFCIEDLCGATYVNGSHMPLGRGAFARLEHNNEVVIGPYRLRVTLAKNEDESVQEGQSIEQLFETDRFDLLREDELDSVSDEYETENHQSSDPIAALDELFNDFKQEQSLLQETQLATDEQQTIVPENDIQRGQAQITPQADSDYEMTSSIRLKKILGLHRNKSDGQSPTLAQTESATNVSSTAPHTNNDTLNVPEGLGMNDKVLDLLEEEVAKSFPPTGDEQNRSSARANHLLTGPMLNGLGVDVGNSHDMDKMHMLSEELGQSLQACVKGLLQLNQQVCEGRFGVMNRNLQPIEDNPLRLGLSYEETIRTLYDTDKSLVHLSAPAAISESLKNVRDHNEAMQHATGEALSQILNAFSPQVLLRRFQHYKRNGDLDNQSPESWAWEMYCHYYQELTSDRQKGFEKLFWEIFEQSYDKKVREKQLEL
ncbi:type VI secretion system-associated FHA domain protein TagH [Vibrio scophthalmi]|uniref:Type VI secretion system FHA domain-containing protein n=1 Tax=Vibrio scophthalmi LMG 19158 TaxID=870967 RepID=F9RUJ5_9VIBR|nr:type VI secretion system-associated FHA domain protein TagH [Vibrio scophthalmi]EGU30264.1 hypothetical protein VIS19158_07045 [Vibrio scophthalmi LMG 19158]